MLLDDTIAAIATPLGEGSLAVIRISGPNAFPVTDTVFVPRGKSSFKTADAPSHTLQYGHIVQDGRTIDEVQKIISQEVKKLHSELDEVSARLVETGLAVWTGGVEFDARSLIVKGQANLLENTTATADLDRMRKLFEDIENKRELVDLLGLAERAEGVRIFIGSENKLFSMSGSSLIAAPFRNDEDKIVGVLGIIGPTRLNYARIIPMVDYTAKMVGKLIS